MNSKFLRNVVILMTGAFFIIFTPILTLGEEGTGLSSEKNQSLTITNALEGAWQNNLSFQKASLTLDNAKINYEKAKANVLQTQSKIDERQAELNWREAQNNFEKSKNEIEIEIISLYNNLKYLSSLLPLKEKKMELAQDNLEKVKKKVETGTAGKLDKLAAEINLENARQQLQNTEHQLEAAREDFSLATGIVGVSELILSSEFEKGTIENPLDIYIYKIALQKRKEIQFAREEVEIAAERLEQLKMTGSPSLDIDKANNDLKLLQINLKLLENSIKSEVRQRYQQLKSLDAQLELLTFQLEQAEENFENAKKQFKAGLITEEELSSKKINYQEALLELQKGKGGWYVAWLNLKVSIGEKLELGEENES